jgi:glutathione S-transferase
MKLYGHPLSGNVHKVRLLLSALDLAHDSIVVDIAAGAHRTPEFLAKNPRGQVPVLEDGDVRLGDAQAILVYLARRYDRSDQWLPREAAAEAAVVQWLSFAANELQNGVHLARVHHLLGAPVPIERANAIAARSLDLLESHLARRLFLEHERATLADLACFPLVGLAPEGKISLANHPAVRGWIDRIQALPFYVGMPGLAR